MKLTAYRKYRLLEVIPGTTVWTTIILALALSIVKPLWMMTFAVVFDLYWLLRVAYFLVYLSTSWRQYRYQLRVNWMEQLDAHPKWEALWHVVFLPTVDEDISILRHTLDAIKESTFPSERIMIVLAGEEREQESFLPMSKQLIEEYGDTFFEILTTVHPKDIPGEIAAKGANLHWAGQEVQKRIDELGWNYDDVIVSAFDVDTVVSDQYFAYLTHAYVTHPNPTRSSYQPLAVYNNNVWESFSFVRVVANSTTFWLLAELARPKPLWTFSSHAMSFRALADVGFWQSDIVTEDSRIFLQCYIHYDGEYEVTPLYVPVSMDTAHAGELWPSIQNLYKQQRRWAWGIEHFPFMIWHFTKSRLNPKKWELLFNLSEGMWSWPTAPLLILILGNVPFWFASEAEKATVIAQLAPLALQAILSVAMVGILVSAVLNVYMLPFNQPGNKLLRLLGVILQWILLPVTLIIFGSIPVIDAQTRLLLGKYLGFYTAKKVRGGKPDPSLHRIHSDAGGSAELG